MDTKRKSYETDLTFKLKYHKEGTSKIQEKVMKGATWHGWSKYLEMRKIQDFKSSFF